MLLGMPAVTSKTRAIRISLRELLILFAGVTLGCAALKYANVWWQSAVVALSFTAVMAAGIFVLVDRGQRHSFAIGFLVCALGYGAIVQNCRTIVNIGDASRSRNNEIERPTDGWLPTTQAILSLYNSIARSMWRNVPTNEVVAEQDLPENAQRVQMPNPYGDQRYYAVSESGRLSMIPNNQVGANAYLSMGRQPNRDYFMLIGHFLWALLLGYVGGKFAQFVYARRTSTLPRTEET